MRVRPLIAAAALAATASISLPAVANNNPTTECGAGVAYGKYGSQLAFEEGRNVATLVVASTKGREVMGFTWTATAPVTSMVVKAGKGSTTVLANGATTGRFTVPQKHAISHVTFCLGNVAPPPVVVPPPVVTPPVDTPPVDTPPVDAPPVDAPPVDAPPVDAPPVDAPPVDNPPADHPPVDNPPVDNPPVVTPPVDNPPVDNPPVDNPPAENPPPSVITPSGTARFVCWGEDSSGYYATFSYNNTSTDQNGARVAVDRGTAGFATSHAALAKKFPTLFQPTASKTVDTAIEFTVHGWDGAQPLTFTLFGITKTASLNNQSQMC